MKAKITARLEISDHDGYCSGDECEYSSSIVVKKVDVPEEYDDYGYGKINNLNEYNWEQFLEPPELDDRGYHCSYYCCLSDECIAHGLNVHDYRYTILSVKLVENDDEEEESEEEDEEEEEESEDEEPVGKFPVFTLVR